MKNEKQLLEIVQKIIELEKNIYLGKDIKNCEQEIQKISDTLTFEEMLFIDDYIMKMQLLKNKNY